MPKKEPQTLTQKIADSSFLSATQRSALLEHIPSIDADQLTQLSAILASQPKAVETNPIARAAMSGNAEFFQQLDTLIAVESRKIRKAEELAERGDEETATADLFNDTKHN